MQDRAPYLIFLDHSNLEGCLACVDLLRTSVCLMPTNVRPCLLLSRGSARRFEDGEV